jgi:hypothetical protein
MAKCPEKLSSTMKPIIINAQGIGERVVINVEPICECECEKKINEVSNSIRYCIRVHLNLL